MSAATPPRTLLRVVLCHAADADEAAAELARRLRVERFDAQLLGVGDGGERHADALLASADVLALCVTAGAADAAGQLRPPLAAARAAASAAGGRALLALRLADVPLPAALAGDASIDYFAARGHERLMRALWGHIAARRAAPPPAPAPPPTPTSVAAPPAFALGGDMVLPALRRQGQIRRLGAGVPLRLLAVTGARAVVATGGGAALLDLASGATLWSIDCPARSGALSADSRLLALGGVGEAFLWDLDAGRLAATFAGHEGALSALAFSPDGTMLAAGDERAIRLWRVEPLVPTAPLDLLREHADAVTDLAFAPDGATLASSSLDRTVRLWRMLDRAPLRALRGHARAVERVAFAPGGAALASAGDDRAVRMWRVSDGASLGALEGHTSPVQALAFAPDGAALASGADDRTARVWQLPGGGARAIVALRAAAADIAFGADGTLAALDRTGGLQRWRIDTQPYPLEDGRAANAPLSALAAAPNGALLAAGGRDGSIWVWRPHDGALLYTIAGHAAPVSGLAFGPDSTTLVSAALDRTVRRWHMGSGDAVDMYDVGAPVRALALSPNGARLALALEGDNVALLTADSGRRTADGGTMVDATVGGQRPSASAPWSLSARGLCWGADSERLALACDDGTVRLWGARGKELAALAGHSNWVRAVAFAPGGKLLASGGDDRTVRLWRAGDGAHLHTYKGHSGHITAVAFVDDDTLASSSIDRTVRLWCVSDGAALATIGTHVGSVERVVALPGTGQIASASSDGTLRLWRVGR
jgi:WD40 repeat protein